MKVSQAKRSRWIYASLIVMLLALLSFSILPLISSIVQESQSRSPTTPLAALGTTQDQQAKLEAEALGYQLVLEREPDNQNALQGLLEVKLKQGDLKGAIAPLERLAQINPQQPDYSMLLAQAKQQVQDYDGAMSAYRTLLALHPNEIRALKGMSDLLLAQNRPLEAIRLIQDNLVKAVRAKSSGAEALDVTSVQLLLGEIYLGQKRYSDAIATYDQAIQDNPQDFRPVLAKALVLQKQDKATEAEPLFKEAITLAPVQYKDQIKGLATQVISGQKETD
jgi:tetratricopeptide (TPR) repeat protein